MSRRSSRIAHALVCLFLPLLALPGAPAQETPQKVYWCRHDNGAEYAQTEPCPPGTEVRNGEMTNGLIAGQDVQRASPNTASTPLTAATPRTTPSPPIAAVGSEDARQHNDAVMREGRIALLKYLAFGLVFGVAAKALGRSFGRWFAGGVALRFVLVALNLMKF